MCMAVAVGVSETSLMAMGLGHREVSGGCGWRLPAAGGKGSECPRLHSGLPPCVHSFNRHAYAQVCALASWGVGVHRRLT